MKIIKRKGLYVLIAMLVFLCTGVSVYATGTPAGTQIKNQATAQYLDANGNSQVSTSNEVITIVQPIYGLTITPNGTTGAPGQEQTATPGTTVYYPYTLTNTGNDDDTYDLATAVDGSSTFTPANTTIYLDANGNGVVDPGDTAVTNTGTVHADESIHLIVAYDVPTTAIAGQFALVNLTGTSTNDGTKTDTDNWNQTTVVSDAVLTIHKSASPSSVDPGDAITYTVSGSNTGNIATTELTFNNIDTNGNGRLDDEDPQLGILIEDTIPAHTHITGNPGTDFGTVSPAGATKLYGYANGNWSTSSTVTGWGSITKVGMFIAGTLLAGESYELNWNAVVDNDAPVGNISNLAYAHWANSAIPIVDQNTPSNTTLTPVNASYGVQIGPKGYANGAAPPGSYISWPYTVNILGDTSTISGGMAGTTLAFTNTIKNTGTAEDIFNITTAWTANQISGATVTLYKADGVTPLGDANADGIPDVGPLAENGGEVNIVVKIFIPGTTDADALDHDVTITATSTEDGTKTDTTVDRIDNIVAAAMDITNNDAALHGETPYSQVASPGTSLTYPLKVTNNATPGGAADTYHLSQTAALPAGWTVEFYPDVDGDRVADIGSAPITSTPSLAAGGSYNLVAIVSIPEGQAPLGDGNSATVGDGTSQLLTFRADGVNSGLSDTQNDYAEVSANHDFTFEPDNSGTATPGGTVFYKHLLKNNGTTAQTFEVGLDPTYTPRTGWTYMFSTDGINYYPALTAASGHGISLAVDGEQEIWVKVFVPANEAINISEAGKVRATNTTSGAGNAYKTRTDITTVVNANLQLTKSVTSINANGDAGVDQPGDELTYTVNYQNLGSETVTSVYIYDAIPTYTGFKVGSAAGGTEIKYSSDNGSTWGYGPTSGGGFAPAGYDYNVTNIRWNIGSVDAGASGNVTFTVRIK